MDTKFRRQHRGSFSIPYRLSSARCYQNEDSKQELRGRREWVQDRGQDDETRRYHELFQRTDAEDAHDRTQAGFQLLACTDTDPSIRKSCIKPAISHLSFPRTYLRGAWSELLYTPLHLYCTYMNQCGKGTKVARPISSVRRGAINCLSVMRQLSPLNFALRIVALSRVAASAIHFWSSDIVLSVVLARMLRALSFCTIKLWIYRSADGHTWSSLA
jgi:hypothetical protein